mmetsp:Transcript_38988/g.28835  ORF Transcript_38988/g.28835 Transcript_38988/m.28835 type:complete len:131 (+) Transcript_38988:215-607(+)
MFVGTSTGGLLAIGLAVGIKAKRLESIYANEAGKIFQKGDISKYSHKGIISIFTRELDHLDAKLRKKGELSGKPMREYTLGDLKVKVGVETAMLLHEKGDAVGILLNNFGYEPVSQKPTVESELGKISLI